MKKVVAAATAAGRLKLSSTLLIGNARVGRGVMRGMRAVADNVEDVKEAGEAIGDSQSE